MNVNNDKYWFWLVLLMGVPLVVYGGFCLIAHASLQGAELIIGGLMTKLSTLIDFRYGSSAGSKEKTELMNKKDGTA